LKPNKSIGFFGLNSIQSILGSILILSQIVAFSIFGDMATKFLLACTIKRFTAVIVAI